MRFKLFLTSEEQNKLDNFDTYMRLSTTKQNDDLKDMAILARGCEKHPSYRAIRPPHVPRNGIFCNKCNLLFVIANYMRRQNYKVLEGKKTGKKISVKE